MDFRFDADVEEFRAEVRAFLAGALADAARHTDPLDLTGLDERFERDLHRRAGALGWLELPANRQAVFNYEVGRAGAPLVDTAMTLAGPLIGRYRPDLLPPMRAGEVEVCIAYTEAGAGSDLSAIESVAEPVDGGWVLSGRKVLVTGAHKADWCATVVRTALDVPARAGMTMFLVPMDTPGVTVLRRPTMNGWTLDEVHFAGVRLGHGDVLGTVGGGWRQLVSAVAAERSGMFWLGFASRVLGLLVEHVRTGSRDGRPLVDDVLARDQVARLAVELAAVERLARHALWAGDDAALSSMVKIAATELLQDLAQTATQLAGHAGQVWAPPFGPAPPGAAGDGQFAWEYLERVHPTISVGANEIQRDTVAQLGLGLPRSGR
jgi:alkylation response protein AidB-like acyl-CoA dehydrogenase